MYTIQRSENVPGMKQPVRMGYPEHTHPDICICTNTSMSSFIPLNTQILKEALLNSPNILESMGLKIVDITAAKKDAEIIKAKASKPKPVKEVPVSPEEPSNNKEEIVTAKEHVEGEEEWN